MLVCVVHTYICPFPLLYSEVFCCSDQREKNGIHLGARQRRGGALLRCDGGGGAADRRPDLPPRVAVPGAAGGAEAVVWRGFRRLSGDREASLFHRPRVGRHRPRLAPFLSQCLRHPRPSPLGLHHLPHGRRLHCHLYGISPSI